VSKSTEAAIKPSGRHGEIIIIIIICMHTYNYIGKREVYCEIMCKITYNNHKGLIYR
jgi:hypothetical protein